MINNAKVLIALAFTGLISCAGAFSNHGRATRVHQSRVSPLHMVFGPKQALAIEKRKNPQKYEATITGLMKTNNLDRKAAEDVSS